MLGFVSAPATELPRSWQGEDLSLFFSMEEATVASYTLTQTVPVCSLPESPVRARASASVAPLFLLCAGTESVINAADVSLGPVFIHVYADSGMLGGWWVEGIDAEVELYGCLAGVTFH